MIRIEEYFDTQMEALAYRQLYLIHYNPLGYGTALTVEPEGAQWVVRGTRYYTCE